MKGLLLKDWYMSIRYCRAFLVLVGVFLVVSFFGNDNLFFRIYPTMIASIIPMSLISYDERDHWTIYSGTLPYTRRQLVSAKYLIGLFFGAFSFLVSLAAFAVFMITSDTFSIESFLFIAVRLLVLGLIGPTFLLPFVFKFGAEKGRIIFYVMIGLPCATGILLTGLGFQNALTQNNFIILLVMGVLSIGLYALSWNLSIYFYQKREL